MRILLFVAIALGFLACDSNPPRQRPPPAPPADDVIAHVSSVNALPPDPTDPVERAALAKALENKAKASGLTDEEMSQLQRLQSQPAPKVIDTKVPAVKEAKAAAKFCCKKCQKGIPCGDSCIPAGHICRVSPGCAC